MPNNTTTAQVAADEGNVDADPPQTTWARRSLSLNGQLLPTAQRACSEPIAASRTPAMMADTRAREDRSVRDCSLLGTA
jgi:hypothetical protein